MNFFGGGFGGFNNSVAPSIPKVPKHLRDEANEKLNKHLDKAWRKVEDVADSINPTVGEAVKTIGKAGKTVRNGLDAITDKLPESGRDPEYLATEFLNEKIHELVDPDGAREKKALKHERLYGVTIERQRVGDHLWTDCLTFTHHGLYVGEGNVVHFGSSPGLKTQTICVVSFEFFADGKAVHRRDGYLKYSPDEAVYRAYTRLGEDGYNLATNNCEHFVEWCRNGD